MTRAAPPPSDFPLCHIERLKSERRAVQRGVEWLVRSRISGAVEVWTFYPGSREWLEHRRSEPPGYGQLR